MEMKTLKYIFGLLLLTLVGCSAEDFPEVKTPENDFAYIEGDKLVVNLGVDTPDMGVVKSRALGGDIDYSDLHLYIIEFDDNGNPMRNTFKTVYTPEEETPEQDRVRYKVKLNLANQPRILHLIALPKDKELNIEYGVEAIVIPSIKTDGETPGYWRRLTFPNGYGEKDDDGKILTTPELERLRSVALIRNFACISLVNEASSFTLKGFAIVNNPNAGTIAPLKTSDYTFPDFLDGNQQPYGFSTVAASYSGIMPAGTSLTNQEAGPVVNDDIAPKYMYERPFNSIRHTYIIIKGRRDNDTKDYYYKLDIGKNDNNGIFRYYSILRNFNYRIILKGVAAQGYETVMEAVQGVVYNNFSFDIELSSMMNISDGNEVVYVNFTTMVLTDPESQTIEFKYRYRSLTSTTSPTFNNDDVNFIDLEPGEVIEEVEYGTTNDSDGWRSVLIKCKPAETETRTQSFTIVKSSGLGRTINLILHRKWTLSNVKEFAGTEENWDASTPDEGIAGGGVGDDLTIFFDIPDNLQEAMFPLTFTLESDRQNIENNPLGMLVVTSGTSGFSGVQGSRIKYEKNVTWTQYNDPLLEEDPYDNGTAIDNGDGTFTHRIRCRFRTITKLEDFEFDQSETQVLITNDNFNPAIVTFRRRQDSL